MPTNYKPQWSLAAPNAPAYPPFPTVVRTDLIKFAGLTKKSGARYLDAVFDEFSHYLHLRACAKTVAKPGEARAACETIALLARDLKRCLLKSGEATRFELSDQIARRAGEIPPFRTLPQYLAQTLPDDQAHARFGEELADLRKSSTPVHPVVLQSWMCDALQLLQEAATDAAQQMAKRTGADTEDLHAETMKFAFEVSRILTHEAGIDLAANLDPLEWTVELLLAEANRVDGVKITLKAPRIAKTIFAHIRDPKRSTA